MRASVARRLLVVLLLPAAVAQAQVPVEVKVSAPVSGWATPVAGDTVRVRVYVGSAAAPTAIRFVGLKVFFRPEAFEPYRVSGNPLIVTGPLFSGVDLGGLQVLRYDANVYGDGRDALSLSVGLTGATTVPADGRAAFEAVLKLKAGAAAGRYTLVVGEVAIYDAAGTALRFTSGVVRSETVAGGAGVNPPPVTFPEAGGVTLDFSTLDNSGTVTLRRVEEQPSGTALPGTLVAVSTGSWSLTLTPPAPFTGEVCFPYALVTTTVVDPAQLRVYKRADASAAWVALTTRLRPSAAAPEQVCADVTEFSEFTITAPPAALPVELAAFTAAVDGDAVLLRWETASESGNAGFGVEVQPGAAPPPQGWRQVAFVAGHGTTAARTHYAHRVDGLDPGVYRFRLRQTDFDGASHTSPEVEVQVAAAGPLWFGTPVPNPAPGPATLRYVLGRPAYVRLTAHDLTGRTVALVHAGAMPAGAYAATFDTSSLPAGVYVLRLQAGPSVRSTRLFVLR